MRLPPRPPLALLLLLLPVLSLRARPVLAEDPPALPPSPVTAVEEPPLLPVERAPGVPLEGAVVGPRAIIGPAPVTALKTIPGSGSSVQSSVLRVTSTGLTSTP